MGVSSWGRLDVTAPWQEYAAGAATPEALEAVRSFAPEVVLGVDWSALPAYRALKPALEADTTFVYLNYRVFTRTATGDGLALVQG